MEAPQRLFPPPHKQEVNSQHAVVGGRRGSGANLMGVDAKKFRNRWLEKQSRNFSWEACRPPLGKGGWGGAELESAAKSKQRLNHKNVDFQRSAWIDRS